MLFLVITGHGLLSLLTQFSFMHHVIYSLMCGRPVVVVASCKMEKEVKAAVVALSLFISGHPRSVSALLLCFLHIMLSWAILYGKNP